MLEINVEKISRVAVQPVFIAKLEQHGYHKDEKGDPYVSLIFSIAHTEKRYSVSISLYEDITDDVLVESIASALNMAIFKEMQ